MSDQNIQTQVESVNADVDVDDLVWQLGADVVDKLRLQKSVKGLRVQNQALQEQFSKIKERGKAIDEVDDKNKSLSDTLAQERRDRKEEVKLYQDQMKEYKDKIVQLKNEKTALEKRALEAEKEISRRDKIRASLRGRKNKSE